MAQKISQTTFIEKAQKIHGNIYDYKLTKYINFKTKVEIECPKHGTFLKTPDAHITQKQGCPFCAREKQFPNKIDNKKDFIQQADKTHNKFYDYSFIQYQGYKDRNKKVKIICPKHGAFYQIAGNHLSLKQGCPKCFFEKSRKTFSKFVEESNQIHNNFYDYSKVQYINTSTKVCIICPEHGEFWQTPYSHIIKESKCPNCKNRFSKSENKIALFLDKINVIYIRQKTFTECKGIRNKLPFDFYLPEYNVCIEFDGRQHFEPVSIFGGTPKFQKIQKTDKIKNQYCQKNNIQLVRISYKSIRNNKKVQKIILDETLNKCIS